jgi:hypothetical protein
MHRTWLHYNPWRAFGGIMKSTIQSGQGHAMVKKTTRQQRLSQQLIIGMVVLFLTAWIGEALIDFGYISYFEPHQLMVPAVWINFNLFILLMINEGEVGFRKWILTRKDTPVRFWAFMLSLLVLINALHWHGNNTYG